MFALNNVSFQGRRVFVSPSKKVSNATSSEIAQTISSAYNSAAKELHLKELKPLRPVTGKSIKEINPGCFDKQNKLTQTGKTAFNRVNNPLGVSVDSSMSEYSNAIKNYITKYYGLGMDDNVCHLFDILV